VILLDKRNLALEAEKEEIIAVDQERLGGGAFVRTGSPIRCAYSDLRNETIAADRIERLVNSSLRRSWRGQLSDIISPPGRADGQPGRRGQAAKLEAGIRSSTAIKRATCPGQPGGGLPAHADRRKEAASRAVGEQQSARSSPRPTRR